MSEPAINWPEKPLGDLFDLARQPITPGAYPEEEFAHYSIPAWDEKRGPAIEPGATIGSAKIAITQPTILVSKLNPRIPRVVHLDNPDGLRHCASTEFMPYVAKSESVVLRFYRWFFESHLFQRRLERIATGSTNSHKRARPGETLGWNVPSPLPDDQQIVAAVLDTVDEAIAKTEGVIAKLRQVRAGLLHDLLTRGLDAHGQLRDPIAHPDQFQDSPLGRIPREWTVEALESCCSHVIDCPHSTPNYLTVGVLVARTMHIRDGRYDEESSSRLTEEEFLERIARLRPEPGDVIFTREAPVGEAFVIPPGMRICLGQRVMLLRPRADKLIGGYLLAQVYSGVVRQRIDSLTGGTTNPHLNVGEVRKFTVPLPKVNEQERIAGRLSAHDVLLESEFAQLTKLKHLKSGLMTDLLTGRVRVPAEIGS